MYVHATAKKIGPACVKSRNIGKQQQLLCKFIFNAKYTSKQKKTNNSKL